MAIMIEVSAETGAEFMQATAMSAKLALLTHLREHRRRL